MSISQLVANPYKLLPLVAILAAAAALSISSAAAPAASGGLGTGGKKPVGSGPAKKRVHAKYKRLWQRVSRRNRRWARRTARCESGRNPRAIGGGGRYRGAFQFTKPTWRRSPKSPGGDPIRFPYRTQAVVAVALKKREGAGHWPHCG